MGSPGTGKTSLARLLAGAIGADFATLSAVMAGVADVRSTIADAQERLALHGTRTVLFLDEIIDSTRLSRTPCSPMSRTGP